MLKKGSLIALICIGILAASFIFQQEKKSTYAKKDEIVFTGIPLNCTDCDTHIKTALQNIIGIKKYNLNAKKNTLTIYYDHSIMQPNWIQKSLQADGFNVKQKH